MKKKIMDALQQKYKNLGLENEVFERVASSVETFITDENLESFVASAEGLLKSYQSMGDKHRAAIAEAKKKQDELETKLKAFEGKPKQDEPKPDDPKQKPNETELKDIIAAAVAEAVKPLQEKISGFEGASAAKLVYDGAKSGFFANDYAKKYTAERDSAWKIAERLFEAGGKKMTLEELQKEAMDTFNTLVSAKGVDTSKPFPKDDDDPKHFDFSSDRKLLEKEGLIKKEESK